MKNNCTICVLFLLTLFLFSCDKNGDDNVVRVSKEDFTEEDQKNIGNNIDEYITGSSSNIDILSPNEYPEFYQYLNNILQPLINTTLIETRNVYDWEITVLKDDQTRTAFAAPGGKIYIYTGLLKFLQAENELLSIIAHEISYIESEKLMTSLIQQYSEDPFFLGDVLLGNEVDGMDVLISYLENLRYPEAEVVKADQFAISLICPFQYNAMGMKTIIDHAAQSTDEIKWLNTRPSSVNRVEQIVLAAEGCGDEEDPIFAERYLAHKAQLP